MHEKRYDELIDIYMKQLPRQIKKSRVKLEENNETENEASRSNEIKPSMNLISSHLEIVTQALLLQVCSSVSLFSGDPNC